MCGVQLPLDRVEKKCSMVKRAQNPIISCLLQYPLEGINGQNKEQWRQGVALPEATTVEERLARDPFNRILEEVVASAMQMRSRKR